MNKVSIESGIETPGQASPPPGKLPPDYELRRFRAGAACCAVLFAWPLLQLAAFAFHSELYSHILLIPIVSWFLAKSTLSNAMMAAEAPGGKSRWRGVALPVFLLAAGLVYNSLIRHRGAGMAPEDYLASMTLAFYCCIIACAFLFYSRKRLRILAFPLFFLIFIVPFPVAIRDLIEKFFQEGSATTAYWMLNGSGMPVFRHGLEFQLPNFKVEVAPECSGIHSSLVLFITSLVAGHWLLRRGWTKTTLVLAIVPLALLRNGFRILTICQLCVRIGPEMIHSWIHRRGGPVFFALSLIPFFLLLILLCKLERGGRNPKQII